MWINKIFPNNLQLSPFHLPIFLFVFFPWNWHTHTQTEHDLEPVHGPYGHTWWQTSRGLSLLCFSYLSEWKIPAHWSSLGESLLEETKPNGGEARLFRGEDRRDVFSEKAHFPAHSMFIYGVMVIGASFLLEGQRVPGVWCMSPTLPEIIHPQTFYGKDDTFQEAAAWRSWVFQWYQLCGFIYT